MTIAVYLNLGIVQPLPIDARRDWVADAQTLGTRLVVLIGFAGGYILFPYGLPFYANRRSSIPIRQIDGAVIRGCPLADRHCVRARTICDHHFDQFRLIRSGQA